MVFFGAVVRTFKCFGIESRFFHLARTSLRALKTRDYWKWQSFYLYPGRKYCENAKIDLHSLMYSNGMIFYQ